MKKCLGGLLLFLLSCGSGLISQHAQIVELEKEEKTLSEETFYTKRLLESQNFSVNLIQLKDQVKDHFHRFHEEIIYIRKGNGILRIGKEKKAVKEGDLIFIPRGLIHGYTNKAPTSTIGLSIMIPRFDGKDRIFVK